MLWLAVGGVGVGLAELSVEPSDENFGLRTGERDGE